MRRQPNPRSPFRSPQHQMRDRIAVDDFGCWNWRGPLYNGYGYCGYTTAHRFAYEACVDCVPVGMQVDHLCRNPACVNPGHMEIVTPLENTRRAIAAKRARRLNRGQR